MDSATSAAAMVGKGKAGVGEPGHAVAQHAKVSEVFEAEAPQDGVGPGVGSTR
jgi:hypothetical protein